MPMPDNPGEKDIHKHDAVQGADHALSEVLDTRHLPAKIADSTRLNDGMVVADAGDTRFPPKLTPADYAQYQGVAAMPEYQGAINDMFHPLVNSPDETIRTTFSAIQKSLQLTSV